MANLFKLNQPAPTISKRRDRRFYHSTFADITLSNVNKETIIPVSMQAVNHGFFISAYSIGILITILFTASGPSIATLGLWASLIPKIAKSPALKII